MTALGSWLGRVAESLRLMIGIGDYRRYVAHLSSHHPGEPVPDYATYVRQSQDRRYGGADGRIGRCC